MTNSTSSKVIILSSCQETARAFSNYFRYLIDIDNTTLKSLSDHYNLKEIFDLAEGSEIIVTEAFVNQEPKGFQMVKSLEKKALLIFYLGEIDIEEEGPFWIVLPQRLNRLGDKIREMMEQPEPDIEEYERLEQRFPELKEKKGHHH